MLVLGVQSVIFVQFGNPSSVLQLSTVEAWIPGILSDKFPVNRLGFVEVVATASRSSEDRWGIVHEGLDDRLEWFGGNGFEASTGRV